jgi:hypothetical protein
VELREGGIAGFWGIGEKYEGSMERGAGDTGRKTVDGGQKAVLPSFASLPFVRFKQLKRI